MERIAVIDMGSNSIRFIVMGIADNQSYRLEYQQKEAIRLGKGMSETGRLSPDGVKRAMACLSVYKHIMEVMGVTRCIAIATAAARSAKDGTSFIERIRRETGIEVEVVSGEREAYLGYLGVVNTIAEKNFLQFDLGGASIEVTLVKGRKIVHSVSIPIGAVTMTDKFSLAGKVMPAAMEKCRKYVEKRFEEMIPWAKGVRLPIIGVGGTVRNLGKIDQAKERYQLARIHNYRMPHKRFDALCTMIATSSLAVRKRIKGLSSDRADLIVAGTLIIRTLMDYAKGGDVIVSGCGLRDGAFFGYYGEKYGEGKVAKDILRMSVRNYLGWTDHCMEHLERVHTKASSLFDQLAPLHGAKGRARTLLGVAAWLHDAGQAINYYDHARHSAFVIAHAPLYGMTHKEQLMAAFIAGFHHGISSRTMRAYRYAMMLSSDDWQTVRRLALLLALAEASDVTHEGNVERLRARIADEAVVLTAYAKKGTDHSAADLEMKQFAKSFKKEYGKPLIVLWRL